MSPARDKRYRRKRWVSAESKRRAEADNRPWTLGEPTEPRTIEVWCEERSHEPVFLASLESGRVGPSESWKPTGPHLTTQRLTLASDEQVRDGVLWALGLIAHRARFLCPECGLDVIAGDRLGQPGARSVAERRNDPNVIDTKAFAAAEKTDALLSKAADAGVSRLSLSALGRILSL